VLFALGIRHVGETVAKTIARRFRSIDELMKASFEELTSVHEIGPKIATSIVAYFSDNENIEIIKRLKSAGIRLYDDKEIIHEGNLLINNTIVISGVFHLHTREEYKNMIEKNGGKVSSSVSGNTTFILAGENMGASKKEKATEMGIRMINESDFLQIIGEE
jgi:DNA ligase (NAD+)